MSGRVDVVGHQHPATAEAARKAVSDFLLALFKLG